MNFDLARTGEAHVNVAPPSTALPKEFEGRWEGAITVDGKSLRLALILASKPDGNAGGTIVSLDQANQSFPASTVTVQGKELNVESRVSRLAKALEREPQQIPHRVIHQRHALEHHAHRRIWKPGLQGDGVRGKHVV